MGYGNLSRTKVIISHQAKLSGIYKTEVRINSISHGWLLDRHFILLKGKLGLILNTQLGKSDGSKVSSLETSAWQRRSIARSNPGVESKPRWSNTVFLVTVERGKSCDTISFFFKLTLQEYTLFIRK